jgi:exosortase B
MPAALRDQAVQPWFLVLGGLAALVLPSYWVAAHGLWQSDDFGHGPIILAVALWLFWQVRRQVLDAPERPAPRLGWPLFGLGLLLYCFGRVFGVSSVEFASQIFVVAGGLLLMKGRSALRAAWFPVFYLVFMVPLPASLVDSLTAPLKQWVSIIVVDMLYAAGYPIARAGVTIAIGPYQLLVADACSGLNSMFSLSALGALFMYIMARRSRLHNAIMIASIVPIAFAANIVRVVTLVLVTYHLGDEAGQGFLHGAAGMVLMLAALAVLVAVDWALARIAAHRHGISSSTTREGSG